MRNSERAVALAEQTRVALKAQQPCESALAGIVVCYDGTPQTSAPIRSVCLGFFLELLIVSSDWRHGPARWKLPAILVCCEGYFAPFDVV